MSEAMTRGIIGMPFDMAMSTDLSRLQFHARAQSLLADAERLAAEQAVMRQWIADAIGWCELVQSWGDGTNSELDALIESGRRLVDGGPDDLLMGVE